MNRTPRTLNRVLLLIFAVVLLAAGFALLALAAVPAARDLWRESAADAGAGISSLLADTTLPGQRESWLWILLAVAMAVLSGLMIAWAAAQGRGRVGIFAADYGDSGRRGAVVVSDAVASEALRDALLERVDIVDAVVTVHDFPGHRGMRVRVLPRLGVPPHEVAHEVVELTDALERVAGAGMPVLVSIGAGARTRFGRTNRVR